MKRNLKKTCAIILLFAALLTGCAQTPGASSSPEKEKVSLYNRGLAVIEKMDTMAESDDYVGMIANVPEILEVLEEIGSGDYSSPKKVLQMVMSEEIMETLISLYEGSTDGIPEELRPELKLRMLEAIPSMLASMNGSTKLAAVSMVNTTDYFIDEDLTDHVLYFYIYEGSWSATVSFAVHEEGIISAKSLFVPNEGVTWFLDSDDLEQVFEELGISGIEISEVEKN